MTEENKTVDVSNIFGASDDVTGEQLLNSQYVSDENNSMKSDIKDPYCLTVMRLFQKATSGGIYDKSSKLLELAVDSFLEFMVSHDRKGRTEFKDSWVALMETNMRKKEGLADQLFGGSR